MAILLLSKMKLLTDSLGTVYQGAFPKNFVCSKIIYPSTELLNNQKDYGVSPRRDGNYPYSFFILKELMFAVLSVPHISRLVRKARKNEERPVIFGFDTIYGGLAAALASKLASVPLLSLTHGLRQDYIVRMTSSRFLVIMDYNFEKFVVKNSFFLLSVNKLALDYWQVHGIKSDRLKLVRVPVDLDVFRSSVELRRLARAEFNIGPKNFVIGFVGRLSPEKNIDRLILGFVLALSRNWVPNDSKLMIVGNGPEMNRLETMTISRRVKANVVFTDFRSDVNLLMNGLDVIVHPSSVEGNPTVVLEAMATKVPIIASRIPANVEILTNMTNAILLNEESSEAIAESLRLIYRDESLRNKLAQCGLLYVKANNDANCVSSKILELSGMVLQNGRSNA